MKRILMALFLAVLMVLSAVVAAADASDAKQDWLDAKEVTAEKKSLHQDAKLVWAADKTPENNQAVIDTGKVFQHAILDEAEAWLDWKKIEAEEDDRVPDDIEESIKDDVAANKAKIDGLRTEVDAVTNQLELGVVSLKMIGSWFELLADVSKNTGLMWAAIADVHADKISEFEVKLRATAEEVENEEALAKLDTAKSELDIARRNIDNARETYELVKLPGTPLLKFAEGNNYLRAARANMINAHAQLNQAYVILVR